MIEFTRVTKTYPTGQSALSDVSFIIEPGEFVFFVGESGAGKTTIMRLLTRQTSVTEGEILFFGQNLNELNSKGIPKLRREVSVVFQDYKLLPDRTVAENISLPLEIAGKAKEEIANRLKDLLELVGLQDKENFFPVQLSGGEAQRVSIARALAIGPKVLFADEPTGNLDHDSAVSIAKLLNKIHELGTTILMATHNLDLVKLLKKREIHISQGKITKDTKDTKQKKIPEKREDKHEDHHDEKLDTLEKKVEKAEEHHEPSGL